MCGARCVAMEGTCSTCGTGTARTHTAQLAVDTTASMYLWPANLSLDRTVFDLLVRLYSVLTKYITAYVHDCYNSVRS